MRCSSGTSDADGHADLAQAGDLADVAAQLRVAADFQGGAEGQLLVLVGQLHDPLAHPAAGAVDADDGFHVKPRVQEYTSIALMISSRSLGTCTARLAKVARRTPRLPSTSSNVFWSVLW